MTGYLRKGPERSPSQLVSAQPEEGDSDDHPVLTANPRPDGRRRLSSRKSGGSNSTCQCIIEPDSGTDNPCTML